MGKSQIKSQITFYF